MSEVQSVPPSIVAARAALADVLASEPVDVDVRLAVSAALSQLEDVNPPYPPLIYPTDRSSVDTVVLISAAHDQLKFALDTAPTAQQAVAWACAARTLRPLLGSTSA